MKTCIGFLCGTTGWGGLEMNHLKNAQWFHQRGIKVHVFAVKDSPFHLEAAKQKLPITTIQKHKNHYDFYKAVLLSRQLKKQQVTHLFIRATFDMSIAASCKFLSGNQLKLYFFMEMQLTTSKKQFFRTLRYSFIDGWYCPLNYLVDQVKEKTRMKQQKIHLLYSGVPFQRFNCHLDKNEARQKLNLAPDKFIFGLIGRFDKYKGHFLVVNAMQLTKNSDYHIVFMGNPTPNVSDNYLPRLKDEIDYLNLENRIHFLPHSDDVSTFYRAIDWCLMTSEAETFGMVTVEAFAHGVPVLGSNRAGTPELIKNCEGGQLFESMNDFDLAHKMDCILEQKSSKTRLDKMQEFAKQFDLDRVGEQLIQDLSLA